MENSSFLQDLSIVSPIVTLALAIYIFVEPTRRNHSRYLAYCIAVISAILWSRYLFFSRSVLVVHLPFFVYPAMWFPAPLFHQHVRLNTEPGPGQRWFLFPAFLATASLFIHTVFLFNSPELQSTHAVLRHEGFISRYTSAFALIAVLFNVALLWRTIAFLRGRKAAGIQTKRLLIQCITLLLFVLTFLSLVLGTFIGLLSRPFHPLEAVASLGLAYSFVHITIKESLDPSRPQAPKYAKQSLKAEATSNHLQKLRSFMDSQKPYLEEGITLKQLARRTKIPAHHLSMVINSQLSMNFFAFINSYRIEEAKRLLQDPDYSEHTLLSIAFEAGFQSKAAFNKAFKQQTGMSPGDFRKKAS
ncbi:MAG: AraC family transcriptional regulator [Leptospiraceae bacterium]